MKTQQNDAETIAMLHQRLAKLEQQNQMLREQLVMIQKVVDNSSSLFWARDKEGRYLFINQRVALALGRPTTDILGKTDAELSLPAIATAFSEVDQTVLATGERLEREEVVAIQDALLTFLVQRFPIFDEQGALYAVGGVATDISQLKRTEIQLRMSEAKNRALLDAIPDILFHITEDGVFVNYQAPRGEELFASPEAFLGRKVTDVLPKDLARDAMQCIARALSTGQVQYHEYTLEIRGTTKFFEARYSPVASSEVIVIIRDVTDLKQSEFERLMHQQQVIEAQKAAIRELSTPLIPLSGNVVLMPILGKMEIQRVQLMMETLLEGIAKYQADIAILDITGVTEVDVQAANGLLQVAKAARLLGARIIITGIGAAMAQTLVRLGADLSSLTTRGSLQQAIAEVLGGEHDENTLSRAEY